jgi:lipopolysaccharide export LptBFGC system permease protein LptF
MARTSKENGVIEGKILARLDTIDSKLKTFEKYIDVIHDNRRDIAALKTYWKIITPIMSLMMAMIGYLVGKI